MRKFLVIVLFLFSIVSAYSQGIRVTEVYSVAFGSKLKTPFTGATKAGGSVYDSLIVSVPYGECPSFERSITDSMYSRYGEHFISVQAPNDSTSKNKADSTYIEIYLDFFTPDGIFINSGLVLTKKWTDKANATNNVIPPSPLMSMSFFKANLTIKLYQGYKNTISKVKIYKYYKPKKG